MSDTGDTNDPLGIGEYDWSTQDAWSQGAWSPGSWSAGAFAAGVWAVSATFGTLDFSDSDNTQYIAALGL
jgi:hypothetical protein